MSDQDGRSRPQNGFAVEQLAVPPHTRHTPRGTSGTLPIATGFQVAGPKQLFEDREIHAVYLKASACTELVPGNPSLQSMRIYFGVFCDPYEASRKLHLLPQFQLHGSGYAVTEMLKMDRGLQPDLAELVFKNIDDPARMERRLKASNLPAHYDHSRKANPMQRLRDLLRLHGSVAVQIGGELGSHFIIVDRIDDLAGTAQLREPYHGWAVAVGLHALERRILENGPSLEAVYIDNSERAKRQLLLDHFLDGFLKTRPAIQRICRKSSVARAIGRMAIARFINNS